MIRPALAAVVLLGALAAPTGRASADSAGPTDYRTVVVELTPPTDAVTASIEGGDSFVVLTVSPGTDVVVHGYQGEPYLWFRPDGSVAENRRSPATYYNEERYGAEIPSTASPEAEPDWVDVADGGSFAWHDHRAHRMEDFPPLNARRGDQILDGVIPILVDGSPVEIHVASTWMPAPSPVPAVLGALAGVVLVVAGVAAWRTRGSVRALGTGVVGLGLLASGIGAVQFRSLPASTDPAITWWLLPVVATALAGIGLAAPALWRAALVAIAAAQLGLWGLARRSGLSAAVLPTDAPFWLDRAISAAALVGGLGAAIVATVAMVDEVRRPVSGRAVGRRHLARHTGDRVA
jgi:hypothetical protein